jgi:hypothetical protein
MLTSSLEAHSRGRLITAGTPFAEVAQADSAPFRAGWGAPSPCKYAVFEFREAVFLNFGAYGHKRVAIASPILGFHQEPSVKSNPSRMTSIMFDRNAASFLGNDPRFTPRFAHDQSSSSSFLGTDRGFGGKLRSNHYTHFNSYSPCK